MNVQLKELKNIVSDNCVTVIINTHRISTNSQQDVIALKQQLKVAEERLFANEDKRTAKALVERLEAVASEIDHDYNLDSLIIFVNEEIAQYTKLPIAVEDRVVIGHTFATRDLVRALHLETSYYILVLSQQKVRLIEAFNDKVVAEIKGAFPIKNNQFYSTNAAERSNASRQDNLLEEYFNRVDKEVNIVRKEKPFPVLVCSEEGNYNIYLKVADQSDSILPTHLNKNREDETAQAIVAEAWDLVKHYVEEKNDARKAELEEAVGQNKFLSDTNEIWQAIKQGRIQTLFIEQDKFQSAVFENGSIKFVSEEFREQKTVVDDIFDELIEANMDFGGDVVFLPSGTLSKFDGFGAITRY